jgi:hypothetical protein
LAANDNPSLFLLNYDLKQLAVTNFLIVPKHFFILDVIAERKPLAPTARRAGWIGSHILLDRIPEAGKIYIVKNGLLQPKEAVLDEWKKTLFLRDQRLEARGWLIEVMKCVEAVGKSEFDLNEVYAFEKRLSGIYPNNMHVKQKIRQQLQVLRDREYLEFVGHGNCVAGTPRQGAQPGQLALDELSMPHSQERGEAVARRACSFGRSSV